MSDPFSQSSNCSSLRPGQSCRVKVTFAPTAIGAVQAFMTISANARNSPVRISLTGTGK
ncbi:MAG: DUF1573 domain-containing protein [Candidatus Binataceae bacterium]